MSDPIMGVVSVKNIHVKEGHNPRTNFDPDELAALASSVDATDGLVQPLAVEPIEGKPGHYWLIDGERRWRVLSAAAEVVKVPFYVPQSENAKLAATAANVMRAKLNPIEEAHGIKAAAVLRKAKTNKEIAKATGFNEAHVAAAMRLLKLPDAIQAHIAAGYVPLDAEPNLRKLCKQSVPLAECVCELVRAEVVEGRDLVQRFGEVLVAVSQSNLEGKPTMIDFHRSMRLGDIVSDHDKYAELVQRWEKANGSEAGADPYISFSTDEIDAARAGNVLIEFPMGRARHSDYTTLFVTDEEWAVDLATRVIERRETWAKEAEERKSEAEANGGGGEEDKPEEDERTKRTKARKAREKAHEKNLAVGRALVGMRGTKNRKVNKLAWAKAAAAVVLRDNENLPAAGLGLALGQLQTVEDKHIKVTNETERKVKYASPQACRDFFWDRIEEAKTAEQVWELLGEALIAYVMVDPEAVPQSRRVNYWLKSGKDVAKVLAEPVKAVKAVKALARRA
jgi:ParB/RepB/Spo0J family partition protein